jgi:hypothetical protein
MPRDSFPIDQGDELSPLGLRESCASTTAARNSNSDSSTLRCAQRAKREVVRSPTAPDLTSPCYLALSDLPPCRLPRGCGDDTSCFATTLSSGASSVSPGYFGTDLRSNDLAMRGESHRSIALPLMASRVSPICIGSDLCIVALAVCDGDHLSVRQARSLSGRGLRRFARGLSHHACAMRQRLVGDQCCLVPKWKESGLKRRQTNPLSGWQECQPTSEMPVDIARESFLCCHQLTSPSLNLPIR